MMHDVATPRSERELLVQLLDDVVGKLLMVGKTPMVSRTLAELLQHQEQIANGRVSITEVVMDRLLELMDQADKLSGITHDDSAVTLARDLWPKESGVQMSPVLFEVDAEHGAHIARAILAGQMVPAPLDPAPAAGERMRCIIEVEGYASPLMLWAESTGICVPSGVLLVLAPIDRDERDRLAFMAEIPAPTDPLPASLTSMNGPETCPDTAPFADSFDTLTANRPPPSRESLESITAVDVPQPTSTQPSVFESVEVRFDESGLLNVDPYNDFVDEETEDRPTRDAVTPPPIEGQDGPMRFGRYELLERIGRGAMATVFRGRIVSQGGFERAVALKVMHQHLMKDAQFQAMFLDEARIAARIHHPNVVGTIDVLRDGDSMMLVMDYVAGLTLQDLVRRARLSDVRIPPGLAVRIITDALAGLHAAHELEDGGGNPLSLIHRDLSPANVLVGRDGIARISDFGVARANARLVSTDIKTIKGSVAYMAPEQARCEDIDRRADVYAMGIVLWELLAGRRLYQAEHQIAIIGAVLTGQIPSPSEVRPGVPAALAAACMRALCRHPSERYPDAASFAESLEAAVQRAGVRVASSRELSRFVRALESGEDIQLSDSLFPGASEQTRPYQARVHQARKHVTATLESEKQQPPSARHQTARQDAHETVRSLHPSSLSPIAAPYPEVPRRRKRSFTAVLAVVLGVTVGAMVSMFLIPLWQGKLDGAMFDQAVQPGVALAVGVTQERMAAALVDLRPVLTIPHPSAASLEKPVDRTTERRKRAQAYARYKATQQQAEEPSSETPKAEKGAAPIEQKVPDMHRPQD